MENLITDFQEESDGLLTQLLEILEGIEGDYTQVRRLEEYGQIVDRMMGAAKSLAMSDLDAQASLEIVGKYCELCKIVSYKASQVENNEGLYTVVVALLLDATEMLQEMVKGLDQGTISANQFLPKTFLERLRWVTTQLPPDLRGSLNLSQSQESIDSILKSMGQ